MHSATVFSTSNARFVDGVRTHGAGLLAQVAYCARVSNPDNQANHQTAERLVQYLIKHKHWSPFEMVSLTLEVETTRDIARQLLRHRSFSFQEHSQRYAVVAEAPHVPRPARLQDPTNRQSSHPTTDDGIQTWWASTQQTIATAARDAYHQALAFGIAKEVARALLPEGLTPSRLYVAGTLRSWLHYLEVRTHPGTQLEHRLLALACADAIRPHFPYLEPFLHDAT